MEFVSFTPDYWNGPRHNRHYFCLALARHYKVLFVSPAISLERLLTRSDIRKLAGSASRKVADNLWTHVPPRILFTTYRFPALNRLFRRLRIALLRRHMRRLGFSHPVLLIWHPQYLEMLDLFPHCPSIYYLYDHLSGYSGGRDGQRWKEEIELIRRAGIVFALSRKLVEENSSYNPNIFLVPNAVDFEHFSRARDPETIVPAELGAIATPRIGYVGSINEKVDLELLELMAERRPDWSIVLIGRQNFSSSEQAARFEKLARRSNVHWIPYREPAVLPAYLKGLDVCLMCYVINGWTYFGDPSKMHEYLATGKPTIGAPLPAILEYREVIDVPDGVDQWIDAVERGLAEKGDARAVRRIEIARRNSYAARVEYALGLIREQLCEAVTPQSDRP